MSVRAKEGSVSAPTAPPLAMRAMPPEISAPATAAAAVLTGLNTLFNRGLDTEQLMAMARPLGADVPFFVTGYSAAWATGIGDRLRQTTALGECRLVLVNPGFPVSTKWVYENFALTTNSNTYILGPKWEQTSVNKSNFPPQFGSIKVLNDLESVTIKQFPEIDEIKRGLLADGAKAALMSGSGPTVFGLFEDKERAENSFITFRRRYRDNVFLTQPL